MRTGVVTESEHGVIRLAAVGAIAAALLVANAHAAPRTFAQAWQDAYNLGAIQHRSPYFIVGMTCKNAANGSHLCHAQVWGVKEKAYKCARLVISRTMAATSSRRESCGPAPALYWNTEGAWKSRRA